MTPAFEGVLWSLLALCGVLLSAACAGVETGIYSLNRVRLALRVGRGEPRARLVRDELDHPNRLLTALLIGNTIATDLGSVGVTHAVKVLGLGAIPAVVLNSLVLVPVLFVFGEVLPKDLFRSLADRWVYALAPTIRAGRLLLTWCGLVPMVEGLSRLALRRMGGGGNPLTPRQRLVRIFEEGAGAGLLTETQVSLAERTLQVAGRTVAERMVPWRRTVTLSTTQDRRALEVAMRTRLLSRYPVVDPTGRVVGVVPTLDLLLHPEHPVSELVQAACWVSPGATLLEALETLRRERAKMAIVGSNPKAPLGVVALSDLLEPLAGSFEDAR